MDMYRYRWKIEMILNSGAKLTGYVITPQSSSHEVATALWDGKDGGSIIGLNNEDATVAIYVKVGEIASMSISYVSLEKAR